MPKVSVVGAGNVGMAIAHAILNQNLADELVVYDPIFEKADGELLDLQMAFTFEPPLPNVRATNDYTITAASDLCIITSWVQPSPGQSSSNLLQNNLVILQNIVPDLVRFSPNTILLVVLNPVETLTYVAWRLACKTCQKYFNKDFPSNWVIGSGTKLDTSIFRLFIANHFGLSGRDVQAYIIGEQGDRSMVPELSISLGGVPFRSFLNQRHIPYERGILENIHNDVINNTGKVIRLKGYTSWGIGCSVADLASSILRDRKNIHPVAVLARGFNELVGDNVFMSLPAQLGRGGVLSLTHIPLTATENYRFNESVRTMWVVQQQYGL